MDDITLTETKSKMGVQVKLDYFGIDMPDGHSLASILDDLIALDEADDQRRVRDGASTHRLYKVQKENDVYKGDIVRLNPEEGVNIGEEEGEIEPLSMDDDESIAHPTAFLYDPKLNVLILQATRSGITPSRFAAFFESQIESGRIVLAPFMHDDSRARVDQLRNTHKLRIRIANRHSASEVRDSGYSASQKIKSLAEEVEAPFVDLVVSSGKKWQSQKLNLNTARRWISEFLDTSEKAEVEEIEISGRSEDGQMDHIRLIEDRLRDEVNVEPTEFRTLSYEARVGQLYGSFLRKKKEIVRIRSRA